MKKSNYEKLDKLVADSVRIRGQGYRDKALKLYPHICGRCGREFAGKNLQQLTVHHRDHDHDNNPENGSNWELLCLYCHDNEHQRQLEAQQGNQTTASNKTSMTTHNPFADLKVMLKKKDR